jgi:hypothetical protein
VAAIAAPGMSSPEFRGGAGGCGPRHLGAGLSALAIVAALFTPATVSHDALPQAAAPVAQPA